MSKNAAVIKALRDPAPLFPQTRNAISQTKSKLTTAKGENPSHGNAMPTNSNAARKRYVVFTLY